MRYLAIDFETNGRADDPVLPCGAYPTQVSVTAFVPGTGEIAHLYDSYIRGAESLSDWVTQNTPMSLELIADAPTPDMVSEALKGLWREGDVVVAHNAKFDLEQVLPKIAAPDHPFRWSPSICTMKQHYGFPGWPTFSFLCGMLGVIYDRKKAHSATYDSQALAKCLQAAHARNVAWRVGYPPRPQQPRPKRNK